VFAIVFVLIVLMLAKALVLRVFKLAGPDAGSVTSNV
jgi:hypothetical protein